MIPRDRVPRRVRVALRGPAKRWRLRPVRMGRLRRTEPISSRFGFDRGTPVDRHYIEAFVGAHRNSIRGRVLEIDRPSYITRFGGDRVEAFDVLDIRPDNPAATIVDDLARPERLEPAAYDCVICTQTLHLIYEMRAAVETLHRITRPGGTVLVTVPGITQIDWKDTVDWYWALTRHGGGRMFRDVFGSENVEVAAYGNVLSAIAFLHGLAADELRPRELSVRDPRYDVIVGIRATRAD